MTEYQKLMKRQERLDTELTKLQAKCRHPLKSVTKRFVRSVAAWKSGECWIDFTCGKCGAFWVKDGN